MPGQKYPIIARPPVMGGKIVSYDPRDAKKIPGVVQIVETPRFSCPPVEIAIVTNKTWAAIKRRSALKIVWDDDPTKYTIQMFTARRWKRQLVNRERWLCSEGDANRALDGAEKKVMAEYYVLDLAQSREPINHGLTVIASKVRAR